MLAIAGGKGGAGKTTTALGLGVALRRNGSRPIVVDADVDMPDLHDHAGADATPDFGAFSSDRPLEAVVQRAHDHPGVGLVPAGDPTDLRPALARCRIARERTLVDCPAGAGPDAATPMALADRTLVVTTPTRQSLTDAAKTAAMSRALGTPVAGVAVRELRTGSSPSGGDLARVVDAPVLGRLPRATGPPLADRAVISAATALAHDLYDLGGCGGG